MSNIASSDGLVTVAEAAALLRLSPLTVRRKIATGELRAERVGAGPRSHYRDRASEYLAALGRERAGVEQAIANARVLGEGRETMYAPSAPDGPWVDALKTGNETAAELELRLECILYEIRRVTP
jgi:excisionase family DNA binding protein